MSVRLAVRFPVGRSQRAAWGGHPGEGTPEWPPSPWWVLRALYATWRERAIGLDPAVVAGLFARLSVPPVLWLPPPGRVPHPRADPDPGGVAGPAPGVFEARDLSVPVVAEWAVRLDPQERDALATLASQLVHPGRPDSVCTAEIVDTVPDGLVPVVPDADAGVGTDARVVRLLVVDRPDDLAVSQSPARSARQAATTPPGTRWATYRLPVGVSRRATERARGEPVSTIRWSVASRPRPSILAAVAVGHVLRRAVLGVLARGGGVPAGLAGRNGAGTRLSGHRHAHFLSVDVDDDGLVESLVLWVPDGVDPEPVDRLAGSLRRLGGHEHIPDFRPCRLRFEACGGPAAAVPLLAGPARRWRTLTPFAPRFPESSRSRRGRDRWPSVLERQVRKELAVRGLPAPEVVRQVAGRFAAPDYRRHRPDRQRGTDAYRAAHLEVVFTEPVAGPIVLGSLCHFGLGLFRPIS